MTYLKHTLYGKMMEKTVLKPRLNSDNGGTPGEFTESWAICKGLGPKVATFHSIDYTTGRVVGELLELMSKHKLITFDVNDELVRT